MDPTTLTWAIVDQVAERLGANEYARLKWRQRGVPSAWRIKIAEDFMSRGEGVAFVDFDRLELKPGRIAA
jgi:hypothetical protein